MSPDARGRLQELVEHVVHEAVDLAGDFGIEPDLGAVLAARQSGFLAAAQRRDEPLIGAVDDAVGDRLLDPEAAGRRALHLRHEIIGRRHFDALGPPQPGQQVPRGRVAVIAAADRVFPARADHRQHAEISVLILWRVARWRHGPAPRPAGEAVLPWISEACNENTPIKAHLYANIDISGEGPYIHGVD